MLHQPEIRPLVTPAHHDSSEVIIIHPDIVCKCLYADIKVMKKFLLYDHDHDQAHDDDDDDDGPCN